MKANAPEKLFITNDEKRFGDKCHSASTEKYVENDIEYIRTDAFIKKAVNYLDYKLSDIVKVRQAGTIIEAAMIKPEFIDEFRNYMKGE